MMATLTLAATKLALLVPSLPLPLTLTLSTSPTPSPSPSVTPTDDLTPSQQAAPGVWAFVAFLFLAISLWLLMRNMNARLRRMSYRAKAVERDATSAPVGKGASSDDAPVAEGEAATDADNDRSGETEPQDPARDGR